MYEAGELFVNKVNRLGWLAKFFDIDSNVIDLCCSTLSFFMDSPFEDVHLTLKTENNYNSKYVKDIILSIRPNYY